MRGMKVLIVHPPRKLQGGAEEVIDQLIKRLPEYGIRPTYITHRKPRGRVLDLYGLWQEANERLVWGSFDVVNCHNFPATLAVWPSCRDTPCVWQCNEPAELFTSLIRRPLEWANRRVVVKHIKHLAVPDKASEIRARAIYKGVETRVIPYGIDYDFFSRRDGGDGHEGFVMLHVGTVSGYKNQMASLKLLNKVKDRIKDVVLVLAGQMAELEYVRVCRDYVAANGLEGRVEFTGHLSKRTMRDMYMAADVLLHPAKQQGGWLAPFEAMAARLPVVVWKSCLASLALTEGTGIVVDDYAPVDEVIADMYANPAPYREMAERGQQWVGENMSWDAYARRMAEYFREVAA